MVAIEFDNVGFSYRNATRALDGLDLRIDEGEFVCVLGSNGSGKSTFARHIDALLVPDEGMVRVLGRDTRDEEEVFSIRSSAGLVFQNPDDQLVASIVEDDVAFGPSNLGVPTGELRERVTRALGQVGLGGFETAETAALSGGQKQLVAIAGALAMQPRILVLDEATAMLDPRGRNAVMRVCRELHEDGLTIVMVTHFMEEAALADRVIVLDRGRVALDGTPREVLTQVKRLEELALEPPFAALISDGKCLTIDEVRAGVSSGALPEDAIRRAVSSVRIGGRAGNTTGRDPNLSRSSSDERSSSPAAIAFENVAYEYPAWALRDITLDVHEGEFFGIAGHTGSGKSTLIQLASGLLKPSAGRITLAERNRVGVVFQYPERQLFAATVFDDVAFGPRNLGLSRTEVEARVTGALELVHLSLDELRDTSPFALSGGLQRRVAIAGVLAMDPQTLIFDEPTAGLDPSSRRALLALVEEFHTQGRTIVLVSHNMDDLARFCDRIAVLNDGRLEALDTPERVFADESRLRAIGLDIPQFMQLENGTL